MKEIVFKFRKKTWKLVKESHGFSLQSSKAVAGEWQVEGYFSDISSIIVRLVKEHFISTSDGKELLVSFNTTCKELTKVLNKAINEQI